MNRTILGIIGGLLFIGSIFMNFVFWDFWQQEKEEARNVKMELKDAKEEIRAAAENEDIRMKEIAEGFTTELFAFSGEDPEKRFEELQAATIGEARMKISEAKNVTYSDMGDAYNADNLKSSVDIKESFYNRINNKSGKVVITFDQELISDQATSTTVNEITVDLVYEDAEWKVKDFDIKVLL